MKTSATKSEIAVESTYASGGHSISVRPWEKYFCRVITDIICLILKYITKFMVLMKISNLLIMI